MGSMFFQIYNFRKILITLVINFHPVCLKLQLINSNFVYRNNKADIQTDRISLLFSRCFSKGLFRLRYYTDQDQYSM